MYILLTIELNSEKLKLKLTSNGLNYLKFNISPTLGLKMAKCSPRNALINCFPTLPKPCPNFFKYLILILILLNLF